MERLFSDEINLQLPDSEIVYYPHFLTLSEADQYYRFLKEHTPWQQDDIKVFGKIYAQPRLTALYGNNKRPYSYSNIKMQPHEFTKELLYLKEKTETRAKTIFTSCLLNLYRNGKDSNGWHADDETELGQNPIIGSISLGQERFFQLKHKKNKALKHKILLEHGSLLLMRGKTQHHWLHQIPKTNKPIKERINLTFRVIR
ncbi:MAG: alpha-ketoglutarate-dependent dioxygenase AlkB [Saonia sp.]